MIIKCLIQDDNKSKNRIIMKILGIETSCDETAVAIVNDRKDILAHALISQIDDHEIFGGVVPEVAARAHLQLLKPLVEKCLKDANCTFKDLDGVAVTCGPGLIGGVMVGVMMAKSIAMVHNKPFLAVNHLAGHALMPRMTDDVAFPYLMLLVSGGHCQIVIVQSVTEYEILGTTQDDAVGECFDKCAKLLGLPYPGGPNIEKAAKHGDPKAYVFPRPLKGHKDPTLTCTFSFSGLKSSVRRTIEMARQTHGETLPKSVVNDIAASLQVAITESLVDRMQNALKHCDERSLPLKGLVVSGGVAANVAIRTALESLAQKNKLPFHAPPLNLCTDNGVMIAWAGLEKMRVGNIDHLDFKPRPRWPLDTL